MREVETRSALQTLENSFVNVENEMKLLAHELEDRQSMLSDRQKQLEERGGQDYAGGRHAFERGARGWGLVWEKGLGLVYTCA